ncbi:MAG: class 1 fructose-bisphosphatase [Candidatus Eiseniibacteriota bacterium]
MASKVITIDHHITEQERKYPTATGDFSNLLQDIVLAAKMINREVNKAGLVNILGKTGETNVQGEEVMKLDDFANNMMYNALNRAGRLCIMASEECAEPLPIPSQYPCGKYVLNFDPLDGSSNIDANVSIGTIFSIHRRLDDGDGPGTIADCMQVGQNQVCAGYVLYGSSTVLVYTTGQGTHGFTFDPSVGEFLLSHEHIRTPPRGRIYSINEGNYHRWQPGVRRYIAHLKTPDTVTGRPYSSRYIGSLVADFHRNLLYGGVFLYPADKKHARGKLRLLYEAAPLAFICEQAGGAATDGRRRILDIKPESLHQRVPLVIGSSEDVAQAMEFMNSGVSTATQ